MISAECRWPDWVFEFTLIRFWITSYIVFKIFVTYSPIRFRDNLASRSTGHDVDSILIAISNDRCSDFRAFIVREALALIVRIDPPRHNRKASFSKPDKSSTFCEGIIIM